MSSQDLVAAAVAGRLPNVKGWLRATCPFCEWRMGSRDKHMSFGVHAASRWYKCFRCEARGRVPEPLDGFEDFTYEEPEAPESLDPPETFEELAREPAASAMSYRAPRRYLMRRGIAPRVIAQVGVGACVDGEFKGRVVVPIKDNTGAWLWYVGRAWYNTDRRYKYPIGSRRGVMFNREALDVETWEPVYVVEGVFDALPHWPRCVACLGKPQDSQLHALAGAKRPVVVVLDGDAWEEGWAVSMRLRLLGHADVSSVRLPPRTDPGDLTTTELVSLGEGN